MSGQLDPGGAGSYEDEEALDNDYVAPTDTGAVDYAGDVLFVRDAESRDRWDGQEWLTDQTAFDAAWEGHEDDTRDAPGSALWGTEDSFAEDPSQATADTGSDVFAFLTGDFDTTTEDGSGDGNNSDGAPWDGLPLKPLAAGIGVLLVLGVLAPYAKLGAEVAG